MMDTVIGNVWTVGQVLYDLGVSCEILERRVVRCKGAAVLDLRVFGVDMAKNALEDCSLVSVAAREFGANTKGDCSLIRIWSVFYI